jgi:hypothetical protein
MTDHRPPIDWLFVASLLVGACAGAGAMFAAGGATPAGWAANLGVTVAVSLSCYAAGRRR